MPVPSKATKAQILQALEAAEASLAQGPSWPQVWAKISTTAATAWEELQALVSDTYHAGTVARQGFSYVVAELSRPVLRSKP